MDITARDIQDWTKQQIDKLMASGIYTSPSDLYSFLAKEADVVPNTVRHFHLGKRPNLSVANLDSLVAALKSIQQRLRAA